MAQDNVGVVHVVWVTAGLGCDGDTVAVTAATQPSLEDLLFGAFPGLPELKLHNPVLAYDTAGYMGALNDAAAGRLDPFILVIEGSIPDEKNKTEGFWAGLGTDPETGQPMLTCDWVDRLAPRAMAGVACGTCATYGGIHAMGLADYLGWGFRSIMPFMDEPPGATMSSSAVLMYGRTVRALRQFTPGSLNREPEWRGRGPRPRRPPHRPPPPRPPGAASERA
jgi:Ni,Fe-hydrogenase I small subunit